MDADISRKLKRAGMFLFLLGLVTGLMMTAVKNPRMGLAAHLEGVMNGIFLVVTGLIWKDLVLKQSLKRMTLATLLYGTFANWLTTLLSAVLGTSKMTPLAGQGFNGTNMQELVVSMGFISVGLTMLFSLVVIIYGLRGSKIL